MNQKAFDCLKSATAFFCSFLLAITLVPCLAFAAPVSQVSFVYTIDDGKAIITGLSRELKENESLVIPDKIDGCSVSSVSNIQGNGGTLSLPSSLESIGGISGFTGDLVIPGNVSEITSDIEAGTFNSVTIEEGNLKSLTENGRITLFPWTGNEGDGVKDVYLSASLEKAEDLAWGTRDDLIVATFHLPSSQDNQKRLHDLGIVADGYGSAWPAHVYKYDYIDVQGGPVENIRVEQFANCSARYDWDNLVTSYSSFKGLSGKVEILPLPLSASYVDSSLKSSNQSIAKIENNGDLRTQAPGKCTISAEYKNENSSTIMKKWDLTVYSITESKSAGAVSATNFIELFNLNPYLTQDGNVGNAVLQLVASDYSSDKTRIAQVKKELSGRLGSSIQINLAYDISAQFKTGTMNIPVQPSYGSVELTIDLPSSFTGGEELVHLKSRGDYEILSYRLITENGRKKARFSTSSFSDFLFVSKSSSSKAGWKKDKNGWWYKRSDGSYPKDCWETINGLKYYFNNQGYMKTGWLKEGSDWYYLKGSGAMANGWQKAGGKWYYFSPSNGKMLKGWQTIFGTNYYLTSSGAMKTGWLKEGSDWYYLKGSGAMLRNSWIGNYWVGSDGSMAKSTWVDGDRFYVNAKGVWERNRTH